MTDEEMGNARAWLAAASKSDDRLTQSYAHVGKSLLAEVDRLRAENTDLHEQLQQVRAIIRGTFDLFPEVAMAFMAAFERIGQPIEVPE